MSAAPGSCFTGWSSPAVFYSSWRSFALKNTILCSISYLPVVFLIYCAIRYKKTREAYKNSVFFVALIQGIGVLPTFGNVFFHLVFASQENLTTTYFWCTMSRAVFGTAAYAALQAPTVVAICRYLSIVHLRKYRMSTVLPATLLAMATTFVYWIYILGWGIPIRATSCSALGVIPRSMKSSGRTIDELSITYGLIAQGCFPCFVIAIVYNILLTQGVIFSIEFKMIVDSTGYVVLGINTLSSFIFIRSFRRHLMELFVSAPVVDRLSLVSNQGSENAKSAVRPSGTVQ